MDSSTCTQGTALRHGGGRRRGGFGLRPRHALGAARRYARYTTPLFYGHPPVLAAHPWSTLAYPGLALPSLYLPTWHTPPLYERPPGAGWFLTQRGEWARLSREVPESSLCDIYTPGRGGPGNITTTVCPPSWTGHSLY